MNKQQMHALQSIVQKIDIFKGLTAEEVEQLLHVCHYATYEADDEVFGVGQPSTEMFIVLQGNLTARSRTGIVLGAIEAGSCCGEMGLFTGDPRTATVVAEETTTGFRISGLNLKELLHSDGRIHIKILQNMVSLLSRRLATTDQQIEQYARRTEQLEGQLGLSSVEDEETEELDSGDDDVASDESADDDSVDGGEEEQVAEDEDE